MEDLKDEKSSQIIRKSKKIRPNLMLMICSGPQTKDEILYFIREGADDVLEGPFSREQFLGTVRRLIKHQEDLSGRDEIFAMALHEILNPLSNIMGYCKLLASPEYSSLEGPQKKYVEVIGQQTESLQRLLDDVLDIVEVNRGDIYVEKVWNNPVRLLDEVSNAVQPMMDEKNLNLKINIESNLPEIYGDPIRLKQVLWNILKNATKYSPSGEAIELEVLKKNGCLQFAVHNSGSGISKKDIPKLFAPFVKARNSESRLSGKGIGLFVSRKLIGLHGGKIWVKSDIDKGATFYFTIPTRAAGTGKTCQER